jgi:hypothetical protein
MWNSKTQYLWHYQNVATDDSDPHRYSSCCPREVKIQNNYKCQSQNTEENALPW